MLCSSLFPQKHDGRLEVTGIPPAAKTGGTGQTLKCCLKQSSTSAADRRDIDIESTHTQSKPFFWNRFWFCRSTLIASRNFHSDRLSSCVLGRKKRCCKGCMWKQECKAKPTDAVVYVANCNKLAFISVKFPCTTYTKLALLFSCGAVWRASSMLLHQVLSKITPIVSDTSLLCLVRGISAQARARNSENSFRRLRADNR